MPKLIVTLKDECCRCKTKIQKVLTCLPDEFCIEKVEFGNCKVTITGKFDADKLKGRLWCEAGKFIKSMEIEKEDKKKEEEEKKKKEEEEKKKKKEPPCKLVHVYPWPYPYQAPYAGGACPWWQGSCGTCYPQQCQCYSHCKPPPPPPPAPPPPPPPPPPCACAKCRPSCSSSGDHHICGGGGHEYCSGSSCSSKPVVPCMLPAPVIVCDDSNPSYACSVM